MKTPKVLLSLSLLTPLFLGSITIANANENSPLSLSQYDASINESEGQDTGPTVLEIQNYLDKKHTEISSPFHKFNWEMKEYRIKDSDPRIAGEGKIIILVHKSDNRNKPEFLEIFRQKSKDERDLEPAMIFESNTSNKILVSTAGTYGDRVYSTPSGTFLIDSMEKMHYSSAYNNAPMPWTMFFNGGIAIHGATPSEYKQLGRKASHGCVRVHPDNAKLIYDFVKNVLEERGDDELESVVIKILDI